MDSDRQSSKKVRRKSSRKRRNPYRGISVEIGLKLILSWVVAIGAIASLFKLVPYHLSQQEKLEELRIQVEETDARVAKLREQLNHNFDPQRTRSLMEQYSTLTSPNKSYIHWLSEDKKH